MAMQRDCALMNKMNNIILTQEIIHLMTTSKSKKSTMAIKIDLEKAFDRLEWGFIRQTLIYFKFPPDWISLIMSCISSSNLLILLNRLDPFHPSTLLEASDKGIPSLLTSSSSAWNTLPGSFKKKFHPVIRKASEPLEIDLPSLTFFLPTISSSLQRPP